ncbi:MAG: hypothetical protein ACRD50_09590 [Candidatus Acidiferrales bacterium]
MDLVWTALGICAVVGFVFLVFVRYWQRRMLRYSLAIRQLEDRVEALERMDDPDFRRRLDDSSPAPLERVFTFSFRISDRFWREVLHASPERMAYVKDHGKFLGSVKLERWRSHTSVTVYEVLPDSRSAGWQSRTIDLYSRSADQQGEALQASLWELPLSAPGQESAADEIESLELRLEEDAFVLAARRGFVHTQSGDRSMVVADESVLLYVPLDSAKLANFRKTEEPAELDEPNSMALTGPPRDSWVAVYEHQDESMGLDWQLCLRDLVKKADWERWRAWNAPAVL